MTLFESIDDADGSPCMPVAIQFATSNIARQGKLDCDVVHGEVHRSSPVSRGTARARAIGAIDRRTLSPGCIQTAPVSPLRQSADATDQSRSNSLMLVLARVRSSTRLTITAQAVAGPGWPFFKGLGGSMPGTTTEYSGTSPT